MQIDLSLEELTIINESLTSNPETPLWLIIKINEAVEQLEEMESMDLDDCAGGACKL